MHKCNALVSLGAVRQQERVIGGIEIDFSGNLGFDALYRFHVVRGGMWLRSAEVLVVSSQPPEAFRFLKIVFFHDGVLVYHSKLLFIICIASS
jgi:hypothetical protein